MLPLNFLWGVELARVMLSWRNERGRLVRDEASGARAGGFLSSSPGRGGGPPLLLFSLFDDIC